MICFVTHVVRKPRDKFVARLRLKRIGHCETVASVGRRSTGSAFACSAAVEFMFAIGWASSACLSVLVISAAASAGHGQPLKAAPAFVSVGAPGMRPRAAASLTQSWVPLMPAISARSLKHWGGHTPGFGLRLGKGGRRRSRKVNGAAAAVASGADGEPKVWEEVVETGEHGFKKVIMEVDLGGQVCA